MAVRARGRGAIDGLSQALRDFEEASATVERTVVDLEILVARSTL